MPPNIPRKTSSTGAHRQVRGERIRSRVIGFASLVLLETFGSCSTETCTGSIACANFSAAQCSTIEGCFPAAAQCLSSLSSDSPQGNQASRCEIYVLSENLCRAASECVWSNATCTVGCATSADQPSCQAASAIYGGGCVWAECGGNPVKQQCSQYPADQCPKGCYYESRGWLSD